MRMPPVTAVLLTLVLATGARADAPAAADAPDDLGIARQALRDGLWEVARAHAEKVATDEARLVILESLAGEEKWAEIGAALERWREVRGDGFDYYRAVVRGDHAAAMAILEQGGSPEGHVAAAMYEAGRLAKEGKQQEAGRIWRELASATNVSRRVFALASMNLMDAALLRKAYAEADSVGMLRRVGLRLGMALIRDAKTEKEGETLVRKLVKDAPDTEGAREAFLAVADAALAGGRWKEAFDAYHEAIETWPDLSRLPAVQEGRGWALCELGRREEALEAFRRAGELADDPAVKARAMTKEGDVLQELGRESEAMARYRAVLERFADTDVAKALKQVVAVREQEDSGRELYRNFRFAEASEVFAAVARADAARKPRMDFLEVLCLYGQGKEDEALARVRKLIADCPSVSVRMDATLWLAKFLYNRREWKESAQLFTACSEQLKDRSAAADSLLWAARAAFAEHDFNGAIQLSARIAERYADTQARPHALLVQGESLIELGRLDEAVLVFDRVSAAEGIAAEERIRARILKADALYAMGADNPSRYVAAVEAYRSALFGTAQTPSERIVVAFKIARALEKLDRLEEAIDTYYAQVVLAYREGRLANRRMTDEAGSVFSRAAFRLADEYERRGKDWQTANILRLVAESDVPASGEAAKRMERLMNRGKMP
ncbi:MAG: tol-pal system YbgF family protein [Kiritimatiellia bacterium]